MTSGSEQRSAPPVAPSRRTRHVPWRRTWWAAGCGGLALLTMLALAPLAYAQYVRIRVQNDIRRFHSGTYRVIGLNVAGQRDHTVSLNLYRIIYEKSDLSLFSRDTWVRGSDSYCWKYQLWNRQFWSNDFFRGNKWGAPHVSVMVVDGGRLLRYHWSFFENSLVRDYDMPCSAIDWTYGNRDLRAGADDQGLHFCQEQSQDQWWIDIAGWNWSSTLPVTAPAVSTSGK